MCIGLYYSTKICCSNDKNHTEVTSNANRLLLAEKTVDWSLIHAFFGLLRIFTLQEKSVLRRLLCYINKLELNSIESVTCR